MIVVAIALVAALLVSHIVWGNAYRVAARAHAREREQLIDKLCHLAGKPWATPPIDTWTPPEPLDDELVLPARIVSPEQLPDDEY